MYRVLVIDDDPSMVSRLEVLLKRNPDLFVETALTNDAALALIERQEYDLALVDVELGPSSLEKYAGIKLYSILDSKGCIPIVISGSSDSNVREISLSLKVFDYLAKPFEDIQIEHKVQQVIDLLKSGARQPRKGGYPPGLSDDPEVRAGLLWNGKRVPLTLTEFNITCKLIENAGTLVSNEELKKATKSSGNQGVTSHINNIRKKFKEADEDFGCIKNNPGYGYYWEPLP